MMRSKRPLFNGSISEIITQYRQCQNDLRIGSLTPHKRKHILSIVASLKKTCAEKMDEVIGYRALLLHQDVEQREPDIEEVLSLYEEAKDLSELVWGMEHPYTAEVFYFIAFFYHKNGRREEALPYYQQTLNIQENINQKPPQGSMNKAISDTLYNMGILCSELLDFKQALKMLNRSLVLREKIFGRIHPTVADILDNIAAVYLRERNLLPAMDKYRDLLTVKETLRKDLVGKKCDTRMIDVSISQTLNAIASVYLYQKNRKRALEFYRRGLDVLAESQQSESITAIKILLNMANIFQEREQFDEALSCCDRALEVVKKTGADKGVEAGILMRFGTIFIDYNKEDSNKKALNFFLEALKILSSVDAKDMGLITTIYRYLGEFFERNNQIEQAITEYRKGLTVSQKAFKLGDGVTCYIKYRLANLYVKLAKGASDDFMKKYLNDAIQYYQNILSIDHDYIIHQQVFDAFGYVLHMQVAKKLAVAYYLNGNCLEAANVYIEEAKLFQSRAPLVALYFAHLALRYLKSIPASENRCAQIYEIGAKIYFGKKQYRKAIRWLQKAVNNEPTDSRETLLQFYQKKQKEIESRLGTVFYDVLEVCQVDYMDLYFNLFKDLRHGEKITERTKNKMVDLFVKLKSILDQAFNQLVQQHALKKTKKVYFPIRNSEEGFRKQCIEMGLMDPDRPNELFKHAPMSFSKIFEEQTFIYYQLQKNEEKQIWQQSWLTELQEIANQNKHIQLATFNIQEQLIEYHGMIKKEHLVFYIHCPNIYLHEWSFVKVLSNIHGVEEGTFLLQLSKDVFSILTVLGYLDGGKIILSKIPLAGQKEIADFETLLKAKLPEELLPYSFGYVSAIANYLMVQVQPQNILDLEPSVCIDALSLLERSMENVSNMVETFAQEMHPSIYEQPNEEVGMQSTLQVGSTLENQREEYQKLYEKLRSENSFQCKTIQNYHQILASLALSYLQAGRVKETRDLYHESAVLLERRAPWLTLVYQKRASQLDKRGELTQVLSQERDLLLTKLGLFRRVAKSGTYAKESKEDDSIVQREFYHMDPNIASQWAYLQEQFSLFLYRSFKFSINPSDPLLSLKLQHLFAGIIIRLRIILEQSYTKFIQQNIEGHNCEASSMIHFPCEDSPEALEVHLRKLSQSGKVSIIDFQEVFEALKRIQPYVSKRPPGESWLELLISISNQLKHESLLQGHYTPHQEIERVYTVLFSTQQRTIAIPSGVLVKEIMERVHETVGTLLKVTQKTVLAAPLVPTVSM